MRRMMRWHVCNETGRVRKTHCCVEDESDLRLRLRKEAARQDKRSGNLLDEIIQAAFGKELFAMIAQWQAERYYFREAAYYLPEALAVYGHQNLLVDGKGSCKLVAEAIERYLERIKP